MLMKAATGTALLVATTTMLHDKCVTGGLVDCHGQHLAHSLRPLLLATSEAVNGAMEQAWVLHQYVMEIGFAQNAITSISRLARCVI